MFTFPQSVRELKQLVAEANHLRAENEALRNGRELLEPLCDSLLSGIEENPFRPSTAMVVAPSSKRSKKNPGAQEGPSKKKPGKISGYNLYMKKNMSKQREKLTGLGEDTASREARSGLLSYIAAEWKKLDEVTKKKYNDKAEKQNLAEGRGGIKVVETSLAEESGE
tara:strand:+ start:149 stop:649 length:501 start_codon:yes stop_codon:yes gene_type:complete